MVQAIDRIEASPGDHSSRPGWRQRLRDAIPLASSLALHASVIAIGLLTARAIHIAKVPEAVEIQAGAAVTEFEDTSLTDQVEAANLAGNEDPTRSPAQDQVTDVPVPGWAKSQGPNKLPTLEAPGDPASADAAIGFSAMDSFNPRRTGPGGRGDGGGGGGPMMPFGPPGGKGGGSSVFPPPPKNVRTVAFVCDASGSMIQTFGSLKAELTKAVTKLNAVQGFNIIFFHDERASAMSDGLLLATPENKGKAFAFLDDANTTGTTNPIPGIEAAFKSKPQLIYLLTDADFPDNAAVLSAIRRLNPGKQTKVNTIAFTSGDASDELSQGFVELMKTIAHENGGSFRLVKENEL